jgi:hypothetical protein
MCTQPTRNKGCKAYVPDACHLINNRNEMMKNDKRLFFGAKYKKILPKRQIKMTV